MATRVSGKWQWKGGRMNPERIPQESSENGVKNRARTCLEYESKVEATCVFLISIRSEWIALNRIGWINSDASFQCTGSNWIRFDSPRNWSSWSLSQNQSAVTVTPQSNFNTLTITTYDLSPSGYISTEISTRLRSPGCTCASLDALSTTVITSNQRLGFSTTTWAVFHNYLYYYVCTCSDVYQPALP